MKKKNTPWSLSVKYAIVLLVIIFVMSSLSPLVSIAHSFDGKISYEEVLNEIQAKLIAIAIELARLAIGLPPSNEGGAYPGLDPEGKPEGGGGGGQGGGITGGASANQPFGGKTTQIDNSSCNCVAFMTTKITMTPAKQGLPETVLYSATLSKLYEKYNINQTGIYLVGSYVSYAPCMKQQSYYCTANGTYPLISIVGTSDTAGGGNNNGGGDDNSQPGNDNNPPKKDEPPASTCSGNLAQDWSFNSGIANQIGDVSTSLNSLLTCMCGKLKDKGISKSVITSISDSNHIGNLRVCNGSAPYPGQCPASGGSTCCWHKQGSCHYGGANNNNKSYAVDLGMSNSNAVKQAALSCGAGYVLDEGNHIHAQTSDCR
jgi:hypothetical protein